MTEDSVEFDLTPEQADQVLSIMQKNGMWKGQVMSSSKEQDARNFVNNAIRAIRAGAAKNNPIVLQVLAVAGVVLEGAEPEAVPEPVATTPEEPVPTEDTKLTKDQVVALLATGTALGVNNEAVVAIAGMPLREVEASEFSNLLAAITTAGTAKVTVPDEPSVEVAPEPDPEEPDENSASSGFRHASVDGPVTGDDIKSLKQLAESVIDLETVQGFTQENYSKDIEELNRPQFNTVYKMLCEAAGMDYPGDDEAPAQEEEPPFEPDPPKAEEPASTEPVRGTKGNMRRVRASDGTLHFKDELDAYEASLRSPEVEIDIPGGGEDPDETAPEYEHGSVVIDNETGEHEVVDSEPYVPPIDQREGSLMEEYKYKREMAEAQARKDNLPIPPDITGEPEPLPADFTTLSGPELRRFHSLYHSYLSRASYLLACEESDLDAAHHIYQDHYNRALRTHLGSEAKDTKVTVAKTAASIDDDVVEWREKEAQHQTNVRVLKQLRDYYDTSCARLSREASMRQAEMEGTPRG